MAELIMYRCHGCTRYCAIIVEEDVHPTSCIMGGHNQKWGRFRGRDDIRQVGDK